MSGEGAETDTSETVEANALPKDELFHLLQNERRRRALRYLRSHDGVVDMRGMAEYIAALENGVEIRELTSAQRKRVYVGLYQCHLPKLDEAGVIEYDKDRGTVAWSPLADQLAPYLAIEDAEEGPTTGSTFADAVHPASLVASNGAVAVVGVVLTIAAWTSLLPALGLWLPTFLTALFVVATLVSALR